MCDINIFNQALLYFFVLSIQFLHITIHVTADYRTDNDFQNYSSSDNTARHFFILIYLYRHI